MNELLFVAGQWLGLAVFVYCACLVITCAANDVRNLSGNLRPLIDHDWDAPERATRNAQRQQ